MTASTFVYVTFIRTTPDALWTALTSPEFTRNERSQIQTIAAPSGRSAAQSRNPDRATALDSRLPGTHQETDWKAGSSWRLLFPDGRVADAGEIVECDPPRSLVIKWRNEFRPELKSEGFSRCAMELEPIGEAVKLTITHSIDRADSKLIGALSGGWPRILSNLKSLLETGEIVV